MPRRLHLHDARPAQVARRLEQIGAEEAFRAWVYRRALAGCLGCVALGLALIALGLTSSNPLWGPVTFWLGVLGANFGLAFTLAWAYRQLER